MSIRFITRCILFEISHGRCVNWSAWQRTRWKKGNGRARVCILLRFYQAHANLTSLACVVEEIWTVSISSQMIYTWSSSEAPFSQAPTTTGPFSTNLVRSNAYPKLSEVTYHGANIQQARAGKLTLETWLFWKVERKKCYQLPQQSVMKRNMLWC